MSLPEELSRIFPGLRNWAAKFAGLHYDVDDLVADTVIDLLEHPWKWQPARGPLKTFMFSMIRNRAIDGMKNYNRLYRQRFRRWLREEAPLYLIDERRDDKSIEDVKGKLEAHLATIPTRLAQTFRLFAFDGKTVPEIAEMLSVTEGNVKGMICRARKSIRSYLKSA